MTSTHHPVLGTNLDLTLTGRGDLVAAQRWMLGEFSRLEQIFSSFDPESQLCRWAAGECSVSLDSELGSLLAVALEWQHRSAGRFNPSAHRLSEVWASAEAANRLPDQLELQRVVASIIEPFAAVDGNSIRPTNPGGRLTMNAIAKGHIVDRVCAGARARFPLESLVLSAGGDLVHSGNGFLDVGVENPARSFDNVEATLRVRIANEAIATSGSNRRGFTIQGSSFSHVIDPCSGKPANPVQVTVVAGDAATADVIATAASVMPPVAAIALVGTWPSVHCRIVQPGGDALVSDGWSARFSGEGEVHQRE